MKMDTELHHDLATAARYCQIAEEFCDRITAEQEEIQTLKINFNQEKEQKEKPFLGLRTASLMIFVGGAIILGLMLIVALSGVRANTGDKVLIALLIPATVISFVLFGFSKRKLQESETFFEKTKQNSVIPQIEAKERSILEMADAAEKFAETNRHCLQILPTQYRNLQATSYMLMAVKNGRADTLKEAINLYEEQLHRWKLEDAALRSAEAREYLAMAVEELSVQQAEINAHLQTIEFMQYLNMHSDK